MGAVFLALFGAVGGLFVLLGAGIPIINGLMPDMASVTGVVVAGLCGYTLMTFFDIIVLVFLFSRRVRAVFYGEPWSPDTETGSLGAMIQSAVFGMPGQAPIPQPVQKMPAPAARAPIPPTISQPQVERETPPTSSGDDLDTPGDLFTEPAPRKR
jgi:hypothetical protein